MLLPAFLVPETTVHENGFGPQYDIEGLARPVLITLGILAVAEQQSLLLSIHSSHDGEDWTTPALVEFPQKFYPGVSAVLIDTARTPARFLRAQWKLDRWGRGSKTPTLRFYVYAELIDD